MSYSCPIHGEINKIQVSDGWNICAEEVFEEHEIFYDDETSCIYFGICGEEVKETIKENN